MTVTGIASIRTLSADLHGAAAGVEHRVKVVVAKTAHDIAATSQTLVHVDTGATKNSIGVDILDDGLAAEIGPTSDYAMYLERGTSRMPPYPYMAPAADAHLPAFAEGVRQAGAVFR